MTDYRGQNSQPVLMRSRLFHWLTKMIFQQTRQTDICVETHDGYGPKSV